MPLPTKVLLEKVTTPFWKAAGVRYCRKKLYI